MSARATAALCVLATVVPGSAAQDSADEPIAWRTNLEAARAEAQASGRAMLVVFR